MYNVHSPVLPAESKLLIVVLIYRDGVKVFTKSMADMKHQGMC